MEYQHCRRAGMALLLGLLAACTGTTPEQRVIEDAAAALGGAERIISTRTLVLEGEGTQHNLGQDIRPDASGQTFAVRDFRRALDLDAGRARTELTRTPNFAYFQGPAPQRQLQGLDGTVAWNVGANGNANRLSDLQAGDRRAEYHHHPLVAVRAALDPAARLRNARTEGGESLVDVTTPGGAVYTLAIDGTSHLPTRISSMFDNANLGDVVVTTAFADYQEVDGLQLPVRLTSRTDDFTTFELRVTGQQAGAEAEDLAAPPAVAAAAPVAGTPPPNVTAEVLAPGVWYLAGQSHHSVLVEFADHLLLIEAPQNEQRTLAVIARARELVPGKPLTQLVNTHHHFDHSGGLRAAIAEGLTVYTQAGNAEFVAEMATRPHTLNPDRLAQQPRPAQVEAVDERLTLSDAAMTLQLLAVPTAHSATLLVAYLPAAKLLVEADLYTPGAAAQTFAGSFADALPSLGLEIERIVPLHGAVVPFAQFEREARATP